MKMIPYGRHYIDKEDIRQVAEALKSDRITQGPLVEKFERALAEYCGSKYAVAVSSGTAGLHLACLAAGIKPGDQAITSPLTFVASANCVLYCGGKPVFADIEPDSGNIDSRKIIQSINSKTRALIPVHYAGLPADMPQIHRVAKAHKLIIIEDACHGLGAKYKFQGKWIRVGNCRHSDATVFSFHPVKLIATGEGGAVLTNRKDLYEKILLLRSHGITKDKHKIKNGIGPWYYEMQLLGFNYRITDIQCALGLSQFKKIESFLQKRRDIVRIYDKAFSSNPYFDLPQEADNLRSAWHLYPVRLKDKYKNKKRELFKNLNQAGIGVQVHYIPVYLQPYYQDIGFRAGICPVGEEFYQREMSLPLHYSLGADKIKFIIKNVFETFRKL